MGLIANNQTYSDQQLKDWWGTGKTPEQVAQDAQGFTADQISQGYNIAQPANVSVDQVKGWVADPANGYAWDASGKLTKSATTTPGITTPPQTPGPAYKTPTGLLNSIQQYKPQDVNTVGFTPAPTTAQGYTGQGYAPTKPADAQGYDAKGYDPSLISGQESVSEALKRIIGEDSPLQQQAKTDAKQNMNSRGLLNTSMAVGAGQDAVVRSALPIAQGDVATSLSVNSQNQGAKNQAAQFLAQSQNIAAEFTAAAKNQNNLFTAEQANRAAEFAASAANVAAQFSAASQNSANAQNAAAANAAAQFAAAAQNAASSQNADAFNQSMSQYTNAMNAAVGVEFQAQTRALEQGAQQAQEIAVQNIRGTQATDLANIEANYRTAIQTSSSAANLFASVTNAMTVLQADVNTNAEQKAAGMTRLTDMLRSGLAVISSSGTRGIDLTSLLNFGGAAAPL